MAAYCKKNRALPLCWLLSLVGIPLLSFFGRPLQHFIDKSLTPEEQTVALIIILAVFLSSFLFLLRRLEAGKEMRLFLCWGAILFLVYNALPLAEKIHVITFGFFGFFSFRLFGIQRAIILCFAMSGIDELLQYFLADRVGEWRDALLNLLSSFLGIFPAYLLKNMEKKFHKNGRQ